MQEKIHVFLSYTHTDKALKNRLLEHLSFLKRHELITLWHDSAITAGTEWEQAIDNHLNAAQLILLLISPAFLASEYCYSKEMMRAVKRHESGEARVIPIILRPIDWQDTPFGKIQALPSGAVPVTRWRDKDLAFLDIAQGIRKAVEELGSKFVPDISLPKHTPNATETVFHGKIESGDRVDRVEENDAESTPLDAPVPQRETEIFGIDLGSTYSCIAHIDQFGQATVIPNMEGNLTTPSMVLFQGSNRIVGIEAKNTAVLNPNDVVEMAQRHMGQADWCFQYDGMEYTAEEISSYILRKLAMDAAIQIGREVKDVVITCPAYFGIQQSEAVARAGEIAGFTVKAVINEPTAAAIHYGLIEEAQDQVVLVYDLGGGTFDITVIRIEGGKITVIATGGDDTLGGHDWDATIVQYLAEQWKNAVGSINDPADSLETLQDLWVKAEQAKMTLTVRPEARTLVVHEGQSSAVTISREKFEELTASLLDRTISFTRAVMEDASQRNVDHFDYILLVGGSTKMPQVRARLQQEFSMPCKFFEPDTAVAKGAALYGQKLLIDSLIEEKVDPASSNTADQSRAEEDVARDLGVKVNAVRKFKNIKVRDVASHSFGIIVRTDVGKLTERNIISNLVLVNDPLPVSQKRVYGTYEANMESVELLIMETTERTRNVEEEYYTPEAGIGRASLELPPGLPKDTAIEVMFELTREGRLKVVGREPISGVTIEVTIETKHGIADDELQEAKARSNQLVVS